MSTFDFDSVVAMMLSTETTEKTKAEPVVNNTPVEVPSEPANIPEPEPELLESEIELSRVDNEMEQIRAKFEQEEIAAAQLAEQEAEILKALEELRSKKAKVRETTRELSFEYRRKQQEWDKQKRAVDRDKARIEQIKNQQRLAETYDKVTANARWRDRALPHQIEGAHFLASAKRALCADSMGLGKTLQSLMALEMLGSDRVLIICPADVAGAFANEINNWTDFVPMNITRLPKPVQSNLINKALPTIKKAAIIVNYETWRSDRDIITWLKNAGFDSLILDEAHRIKEVNTTTYRGVSEIALSRNMCDRCSNVVMDANGINVCKDHGVVDNPRASIQNLICMTGTPILNRPGEIFASLHLINPDAFPDPKAFREDFTNFDGSQWGYGGEARLAEQISGFYIRRTLDDAGVVLPKQTKTIHEIEITQEEYPKQYKLLDMLWTQAQAEIEDDGEVSTVTFMNILALITRQRQASVWPGGIWVNEPVYDEFGMEVFDDDGKQVKERIHIGKHYEESAKLDYAEQLYSELRENGHRVVFFSQFKEALKEMKRRLGDEAVEYTGDTSPARREDIKRNFDASVGEDAKWNAVLCHYVPGGVGLTLTAATAMIILDEEWNEGKLNQAFDRIRRIGQERETQVHILRHVGPQRSIDMWLADLIAKKTEAVDGFNTSIEELKGAFSG